MKNLELENKKLREQLKVLEEKYKHSYLLKKVEELEVENAKLRAKNVFLVSQLSNA